MQITTVTQNHHISEAVMNSSQVLQLHHSVKSPQEGKIKYI